MLQRTRVATVVPFYERFMREFPTVEALAQADEQRVLALWQGLGFYRRCRMLQQGARWVVEHGMPESATEWRKAPGVGAYTAGAIASIALGEAAPLVDGNVERVFARLTASPLKGARLRRSAWDWATAMVDPVRPGDWNQALMELGATVCTPRNPQCKACPAVGRCKALAERRPEEYPRTEPAREVVHLRHTVWAPVCDGAVGVRQVPEGRWWAGLWEFPRVEGHGEQAESELRALVGEAWPEEAGRFSHSVTHHRIRVEVFLARCESRSGALRWVAPQELSALPMPAPQRKAAKMALALG